MLVSELIALLQEKLALHGDVEVETAWEGTQHDVKRCGVYLVKPLPNALVTAWRKPRLRINAEDTDFYKEEDAVDPNEGGAPEKDEEE